MKTVDATFEIAKEKFSIIFQAVNCYESSHSVDDWEFTDDHQGGVTIKNPDYGRLDYKYAIPSRYTLKQLMKDYAEMGVENPSRKAYESLQNELKRDLDATQYNLSAKVIDENEKVVLDDFYLGYAFDWSYLDGEDLEVRLKEEVENSDGEALVLEELQALKEAMNNLL